MAHMDCPVARFFHEDTPLTQARHRCRAIRGIAWATLGLAASLGAARGESSVGGVVLTQGASIQPAISQPTSTPAPPGQGCAPGTFKPLFKAGCAKPSADSALPANDSEPMKFEAIQLSRSISFLQATGTITKDTPAEFARFMATDGAKTSRDLNIHSPGGDLRAAIDLGRAIRKARLNTSIERSIRLEGAMKVFRYKDPACTNACAYAFLGGVSRSYAAEATYAPGSAAPGDVAPYLEEMGIPSRLLQAPSGAVTSALGKEWHVIFDASGLTTFAAEERDGKTEATFNFTDRGHKFGGKLFCEQGHRTMMVLDVEDSVHPVLRIMDEFPAGFDANGRKISGTATYVGKTERSPALVLFDVPALDERSFSGTGLVLTRLINPQLSPAGNIPGGTEPANRGLLDALSWGDAESAFLFRIAADNGERVLPAVFKTCK